MLYYVWSEGDIFPFPTKSCVHVSTTVLKTMSRLRRCFRLERECNKDGTYNGVRIKKGMVVSMAVFPLHYSEENYSEPEKFDPDR